MFILKEIDTCYILRLSAVVFIVFVQCSIYSDPMAVGAGCVVGTGNFRSKTRLAFSVDARATSSASTPRHFATVWATIGRVQGSFRPG